MSSDPLACYVVCGVEGIAEFTARVLRQEGIRIDPAATIIVVLDIPRGYALHTLEARTYAAHPIITVTDSPCAEYWEDLWDLGPAVLLVADHLELVNAIRRASAGERFRQTPGPATALTPAQRRVLRLLARGYSNQQIAEQLAMQRQTVKNILAAIYLVLELHNRNQALLHYWGVWRAIASGEAT